MNFKFKSVNNLITQINNFTIEWNQQINDCSYMFYNLSNITYIDLSYFDTSQVNNIDDMFHGCSNLISLNLFNFNTSSVTSMILCLLVVQN